MILNIGEKVHVIFRRKFDTDLRRHFAGEVTDCSDSVARLRGYTFVLNAVTNTYLRIEGIRTRIISLVDTGNIINILPQNANVENTGYSVSKEKHLVVTDEETFCLDINEFGVSR